MKMEINKIVKLSSDEKYIVLNELNYNNNLYYLTMGLVSDNEYDSSKVIIFKEEKDESGFFVEKVIDSNLLYELTKLFKEQL